MTDPEVADFLQGERTVVCATNGHDGFPHLMPLWYVLRPAPEGDPGPQLWAWTYAVSQKVRNIERDPRVTLQVETGESYEQLRGVMLTAQAVVHRDPETVARTGLELLRRYSAPRGATPRDELPAAAREAVLAQAAKRIAREFVEERRATWDHSKLAGTD
jgi:PPOX class probable F420-dependent enzyme